MTLTEQELELFPNLLHARYKQARFRTSSEINKEDEEFYKSKNKAYFYHLREKNYGKNFFCVKNYTDIYEFDSRDQMIFFVNSEIEKYQKTHFQDVRFSQRNNTIVGENFILTYNRNPLAT